MIRIPQNRLAAARPGFTVVELLVAMVISFGLLAAAVSFFTAFQRSIEHQRAVREVQSQVHRGVEHIVRLVRSAHEVHANSTDSRLGLTGGHVTQALCGNNTCWIERTPEGRLMALPDGGAGFETELAHSVTNFAIEYGHRNDGVVDQPFQGSPGASPEDVAAVRVVLTVDVEQGRGRFTSEDVTFHAVLRTKVLEQFMLGG